MMEKIESGEDGVDFVLVFKLFRFGRNAADVLNSLQTMAGRMQKAREGKWNGGFAPYGYALESGGL